MKEAIEFLLKLAQEKLNQYYSGKKAMRMVEDLLELQCKIQSLPTPTIQRYRKPEQLCFWHCDKSLLSSSPGGKK